VNFGAATYGLGLLAGTLSTLSPCVLPLVPVLVATAAGAHRYGPLALGAGLTLSFTVVGLALTLAGGSLGLDADAVRLAGAVALVGFGLLLLVPWLQRGFARATGGLGNAAQQLLARLAPDGLAGQLLVGLLLGIVWSPCVGPTLGAATTLASRGEHLWQVGALMATFGLGAAAPLVFLGTLSRTTMQRIRGTLVTTGALGKQLLGAALLVTGVLIAGGWDQPLQAWVLDHTPAGLTALTTRY